jgi:hypothetical protein
VRVPLCLAVLLCCAAAPAQAQGESVVACTTNAALAARLDSTLHQIGWDAEGRYTTQHEALSHVIPRLRQVLDAAPLDSAQWRSMFVLTRFMNIPDSAVALARFAVQRWPQCAMPRAALAQAESLVTWRKRR